MIIIGYDVELAVAARMGGNVNIDQFRFYVFWPCCGVMAILLCAWVCNAFRRGFWILGLVGGASLLALLPYLFLYGGGM